MNLNALKERLNTYKEKDIVITDHARKQAEVRNIDIHEVIRNITQPDKLVFAEEQPAKHKNESKYNCYFAYAENYYHRYILVLDGKVLIVTIIGINRRWQKAIEGRRWRTLNSAMTKQVTISLST